MTLLSFCQAACESVPIAAPSAICANTQDETALLLLALANQAGQSLARRPQGGWIEMIREYDFYTKSYPNPIAGELFNAAGVTHLYVEAPSSSALQNVAPNSWVANGPGLSNGSVVIGVVHSGLSYDFTINTPTTGATFGSYTFGQSDYALPTDFQRSVDNTFWDRSRFWAMRGAQSPQEWQVYKSSVIGRASIQRRYRFRNADWLSTTTGATSTNVLSIDPTPFDNGSQLVFEYVSNGWCASASGARQSSWQADSDVGVLDEWLMELGVRWRLLRRLGMAYNEELDEYEREVDKAVAVNGGSAILDLTPNQHLTLIGPWNLPETNFGNVTGS